MAEQDVDILISVDTDATETLKELAALRAETADLRKEQKELDRSTEEGRVEYERLGVQIRANSRTIQQYQKEIVNTMTQEKAQEGSIKSLRAELSNAKAAYAELSREERAGAQGRELLDKTAALNAELKELESAYGDNQRKVGEYEIAGKSLSQELGELTAQLQSLAAQGLQTSESYQQMFDRATQLKAAQDEVSQGLANTAKNGAQVDGLAQSVNGVVVAYAAWKQASELIGVDSEELDKIIQNLVIVYGALRAAVSLQALAQKQSNAYRAAATVLQKLGIRQTTAETVATSANVVAIQAEAAAENASTVAKTKGVVATKLVTAAQWLWNAAMSANPVLIIVVAIAALIAGIAALIGWMNRESDAARDARAAQEAYNAELEQSEIRLKNLETAHSNSIRQANLQTRLRIEQLRSEGAAQTEIDALKRQSETDLRLMEIAYQKQRQAESQALIDLKQKELDSWIAAQSQVREGSTQWRTYAKDIEEATIALNGHRQTMFEAGIAIQEIMQNEVEAARESEQAQKDVAKAAADAARARLDAAISAYEKELDAQRKTTEALIKAEAGYLSSDLKTRQSYAQRIFALNQSTEKAKLDNLRKNNRITEQEYTQSLQVMQAALTEFSNGQINELNSFFESERDAIVGMLTQTLDEQLANVEKQYNDAIKRLASIEPPTMLAGESQADYDKRLSEYETFAAEQANIAIRLEEERDAKLQSVRDSALSAQIKQIEDAATQAYSSDLAQYQNNERAKLDILEKQLREQMAAKKAAGLETYNEEAQLDNLASQRTALNLTRDLALAGDNAKKRYEAKKTAYEAELALAEGNADLQLEITQKIADAERELTESRITAVGEWLDVAGQLLDGFMDIFSAGLDAQLQKVQENYDKESLALADKYAQGVLTEAQYNKETMKLDQQKAKEEAKIERERAIQERISTLFSIAASTATAIMQAVATSPLTGGLPWTAIIGALSAVQIAGVLAQPLPKAARGGLISGPSHAAGGAIIEAEGGEAIITRRAVSMFGPVLSALNELGGGVPFAGPLGDGGYSLRASTVQRELTADEMAEAMRNVTIYTTVEDINRGQDQYAQIQARGTVLE